MSRPQAVVLLVGDELLSGRVVDVNGPLLCRQLTKRGWHVTGVFVVGDDAAAIERSLRRALASQDASKQGVIVVAGGLGPTEDDRTRQAIAAATSDGVLVSHREAEAWIRERFVSAQRVPSSTQLVQARVPPRARVFRNRCGVAPAFAVTVDHVQVVALPGVPEELQRFWTDEVFSAALTTTNYEARSIRFFVAGMGETACEATLQQMGRLAPWSFAFYPAQGEVEVIVTPPRDLDAKEIAQAKDEIEAAFSGYFYSPKPGEAIEHVVVDLLRARVLTVCTAESLTGGELASMFTRVPGASGVFQVGWVTYASEQKTQQLDVALALINKYGVVSEQVAMAMATGARSRGSTDYALATTGVAGPGSLYGPKGDEIPPGTAWIALATPHCIDARLVRVAATSSTTSRRIVQRRVAVAAMDMLRRSLDTSST